MAYCTACGHAVPNDARFCHSCGAKQDVQVDRQSQPNTTANSASGAPVDAAVSLAGRRVVTTFPSVRIVPPSQDDRMLMGPQLARFHKSLVHKKSGYRLSLALTNIISRLIEALAQSNPRTADPLSRLE
jgi:hypothetical protein